MKKIYMGLRLRRLRAERGLTQVALAQTLGLSPSYLNQLEQNQRPLTVSVLLRIHRALGVDIEAFSEDEESRLVAGMREALADAPEAITVPELKEVATQMPSLARALIAQHRRRIEAQEQLETMALRVGDDRAGGTAPRAQPFEVVRDFFFSRQNYFDAIDRSAEGLADEVRQSEVPLTTWLAERLGRVHGVRVLMTDDAEDSKRRYDAESRVLRLSSALEPGQQAFQLGTQLALLGYGELLEAELNCPPFLDDADSRAVARIGLANYFAGALLLPYARFHEAAETLRHDLERLGMRFGVGFETVCHRLSTLQRLGIPGIPFFFVRVDRAGNISKRQSATHFHFSRAGGTCPLWNVYEAFAQPERILPQIAQMPDGRRYLWIARAVSRGAQGYGSPRKTFSIGLGCDVRHAPRLVYAKGLNLNEPEADTPIGMGCKVCEREHCAQRAFPFLGRPLVVDANQSRFAPYSAFEGAAP